MSDNGLARKHGVSKAFRQYSKRYGAGVSRLIQNHKKFPAPMIDHARDRKERNRER